MKQIAVLAFGSTDNMEVRSVSAAQLEPNGVIIELTSVGMSPHQAMKQGDHIGKYILLPADSE